MYCYIKYINCSLVQNIRRTTSSSFLIQISLSWNELFLATVLFPCQYSCWHCSFIHQNCTSKELEGRKLIEKIEKFHIIFMWFLMEIPILRSLEFKIQCIIQRYLSTTYMCAFQHDSYKIFQIPILNFTYKFLVVSSRSDLIYKLN